MERICPYPGLRPFLEEESIFFKGRETQTEQVIALLEERKFLMITGASGDGKSSLTYAGLIPQAKAGFFKSRYNQWRIADFRPEREPLHKLVKALAMALNLDPLALRQQLSQGFSAMLDAYKDSSFWIDVESDAWNTADEAARKAMKRKGANLLILADQFEEFFTNPENYHDGQPSDEAQLVVNLLIETARMARQLDLPVYVVCTMRSDYIGQCAAFRGLPELIGYSQFFVPRLRRKELQAVINGPAALAGCRVTPRLSETLINQLGNGFDQLPVLQHALSLLWQEAYGGGGEGPMDLPHLARLGGVSPEWLTPDEADAFRAWCSTQSAERNAYFHAPCLENVLNLHADALFLNAVEVQMRNPGNSLSRSEVEDALGTAFQCLVKTDAGRTVRSRTTLREMVQVVNLHALNEGHMALLLHDFRTPGNTLLRPFSWEVEHLQAETVLDITHESLIRNWDRLKDLAASEESDLRVWSDLHTQVHRWNQNGRTSDYLLPLGPFSHFNQWYERRKPNAAWLVQAGLWKGHEEAPLQRAERELALTKAFLKRSSRANRVGRLVLRYGLPRLVASFGILVLMLQMLYYLFDFSSKREPKVVQQVSDWVWEEAPTATASLLSRAEALLANHRYEEGKHAAENTWYRQPLARTLLALPDDSVAYELSLAISNVLWVPDSVWQSDFRLFGVVLKTMDSLNARTVEPGTRAAEDDFRRWRNVQALAGLAERVRPGSLGGWIPKASNDRLRKMVLSALKNPQNLRLDRPSVFAAFEHALSAFLQEEAGLPQQPVSLALLAAAEDKGPDGLARFFDPTLNANTGDPFVSRKYPAIRCWLMACENTGASADEPIEKWAAMLCESPHELGRYVWGFVPRGKGPSGITQSLWMRMLDQSADQALEGTMADVWGPWKSRLGEGYFRYEHMVDLWLATDERLLAWTRMLDGLRQGGNGNGLLHAFTQLAEVALLRPQTPASERWLKIVAVALDDYRAKLGWKGNSTTGQASPSIKIMLENGTFAQLENKSTNLGSWLRSVVEEQLANPEFLLRLGDPRSRLNPIVAWLQGKDRAWLPNAETCEQWVLDMFTAQARQPACAGVMGSASEKQLRQLVGGAAVCMEVLNRSGKYHTALSILNQLQKGKLKTLPLNGLAYAPNPALLLRFRDPKALFSSQVFYWAALLMAHSNNDALAMQAWTEVAQPQVRRNAALALSLMNFPKRRYLEATQWLNRLWLSTNPNEVLRINGVSAVFGLLGSTRMELAMKANLPGLVDERQSEFTTWYYTASCFSLRAFEVWKKAQTLDPDSRLQVWAVLLGHAPSYGNLGDWLRGLPMPYSGLNPWTGGTNSDMNLFFEYPIITYSDAPMDVVASAPTLRKKTSNWLTHCIF